MKVQMRVMGLYMGSAGQDNAGGIMKQTNNKAWEASNGWVHGTLGQWAVQNVWPSVEKRVGGNVSCVQFGCKNLKLKVHVWLDAGDNGSSSFISIKECRCCMPAARQNGPSSPSAA
jgi:hypothetical protein